MPYASTVQTLPLVSTICVADGIDVPLGDAVAAAAGSSESAPMKVPMSTAEVARANFANPRSRHDGVFPDKVGSKSTSSPF